MVTGTYRGGTLGIRAVLLASLALLQPPREAAAGWSCGRGTPERSGRVEAGLPRKELNLLWTHHPAHPPGPAWRLPDTRMEFDYSHGVAFAGDLVCFGGSVDGKIHALEATSGEEAWSFHTGGPVRFTPTCWQAEDGTWRVFAVSDDGHVYCLSAEGKLLWKRRGGRDDSRVLGNDRMISRWPARGGPVVRDGVLYFAAGIWPSEGIYVYALDVESGDVLWVNDEAGGIYMAQPHGGANAYSGISAQGYLVATEDRLLVPTGRAVPASLDRKTGDLQYFHLQRYGQLGGGPVSVIDDMAYHSDGVWNLSDGQLLVRGVNSNAVCASGRHVIYATGDGLSALDRREPVSMVQVKVKRGNQTVMQNRPALRPVWTCRGVPGGAALICVGDAVVTAGREAFAVVGLEHRQVRTRVEVPGGIDRLAADGKRLLVSTRDGAIRCYGVSRGREPRVIRVPPLAEPYPQSGREADIAGNLLRQADVNEGYALVLGDGDGSLSYHLASKSKLRIIAVDTDRRRVAEARKRLDAAGMLGTRVNVLHDEPPFETLPDYFASLVIDARGLVETIDQAPRWVRPYGGAFFPSVESAPQIRAEGPEGAGQWTHQYANPANTGCSSDEAVHGPLGMLWFAEPPLNLPNRHGRGPAPLFVRGRLVTEGIDAIRAVDAYTGRLLWTAPFERIGNRFHGEHLMGVAGTHSNLCADHESLYVAYRSKIHRLDLGTGKTTRTYAAPRGDNGKPGTWWYVARVGNLLLASLADTDHRVTYRFLKGDMSEQYTESHSLLAMHIESGEVAWRYDAEHSIRHNAIAAADGKVLLIDRPQATFDRRRGAEGRQDDGVLIALDARDGEVLWRRTQNIYGTVLSADAQRGLLLMSYQHTRFRLASEVGGRMSAYRLDDGRHVWTREVQSVTRPILVDGTIYAQPGAWDLRTGLPKLDQTGASTSDAKPWRLERSYGCGQVSASRHMLLFRSATFGYIDLDAESGTKNYGGFRPGCWINALPVGGIVLVPDATSVCRCSYLIKTSVALAPRGHWPPQVRPDGGVFREPVHVKMMACSTGDIRYTTDGSMPTSESPLYGGAVRIDANAVLHARLFDGHRAISTPARASFIIDRDMIPVSAKGWATIDFPHGSPPRSDWAERNGTMIQSSNIFQGDAGDPDPKMPRPGSIRVWWPGRTYVDGDYTLQVASSDNDTLGVIFRCRGKDQYYLWAMDAQRKFRIIARRNGPRDDWSVLAHKAAGFAVNKWHDIRVRLRGPRLQVYVDGELDLETRDDTHRRGAPGLYTWGCTGSKFRRLRWTPAR